MKNSTSRRAADVEFSNEAFRSGEAGPTRSLDKPSKGKKIWKRQRRRLTWLLRRGMSSLWMMCGAAQGFVLNDASQTPPSLFSRAISSTSSLGPKQLGSDVWTEASRVAAGVEGVWSRDKFLAQVPTLSCQHMHVLAPKLAAPKCGAIRDSWR